MNAPRCGYCGRDASMLCLSGRIGCDQQGICRECEPERRHADKAVRRLAANGQRMRKQWARSRRHPILAQVSK